MHELIVVDCLLDQVVADVARFAPERGGALIGLAGQPLVHHFVYDARASVGSASFTPSDELGRRVNDLERSSPVEFRGILHSHPGALDRPSWADERELAVGLGLNPHLAYYLAPIVTTSRFRGLRGPAPLGPHELALDVEDGSAKVSFFRARRSGTDGRPPDVSPVPVRLMSLWRDLRALAGALRCATGPAPITAVTVGGVAWLASTLDVGAGCGAGDLPGGGGGAALTLLVPPGYPLTAPVVLASLGEETEQLPLSWDLSVPDERRLIEAVCAVVEAGEPRAWAFGPPGGPAITGEGTLPGQVLPARWTRRLGGAESAQRSAALSRGATARLEPALASHLAGANVVIAGCGSVGSYLAEQLVRSGVSDVVLIDGDDVGAANLSRSTYRPAHLQRPKVEALAEILAEAAPGVRCTPYPVMLGEVAPLDLDAHVRRATVVVGATDDPDAQRRLCHFAYARRTPAVFVGLYAGAEGGEVVLSVPGLPCYVCATAVRHFADVADPAVGAEPKGIEPDKNYETGRLHAQLALVADIHQVSAVALKLIADLIVGAASATDTLAAGQGHRGTGSVGPFLRAPLERGETYFSMSMTPDFWFYPQIFGSVPGQHAYQSVWLRPEADAGCTICGPPGMAVDPLDLPAGRPRFGR